MMLLVAAKLSAEEKQSVNVEEDACLLRQMLGCCGR